MTPRPAPKKNVTLSIVVPFYNEVAFIETAVMSVMSQSLESFEIIIVNDNPDGFDQIYFDSLKLPEVVRVVHHERNRGLPSSRNTGIKAALGEFIGFLDADDYYLPGGLAEQLKTAINTGADVTHGQAVVTFVNKFSGHVHGSDAVFLGPQNSGVYDGLDVVEAGFAIESSWSSVYRSAFLAEKQVAFDEEQVKFEDRLFVVEMLLAADRLAIMGKPVRAWRKRQNSITTSSKTKRERELKIHLFEKCLTRWGNSDRADARYWMMRELIRQSCFMITKNEASPWYSAFGFSDDPDSTAVTEKLSDIFARHKVTVSDVAMGFVVQDPRYAAKKTGNGKVTPNDLYTFINSVAEKNYDTTRDVILQCFARPVTEKLPVAHTLRHEEPIEIILHLGLHKTGTTHVQQQLDANRAVLAKQGILFPKTGLGFGKNHSSVKDNGLPGHQQLITAIFQDQNHILARLKGEILGSNCKSVIISAENLSEPQGPSKVRARRIRRVFSVLSEIGNVRPILMYRRPDAWLQSYFGELVSNGNVLGYQTPGEFLENNAHVLHFGEIVQDIESAIGTQCEVMEFDDALNNYEDLTYAFLDLCGLSVEKEDMTMTPNTKYPSSCNAQLRIARMMGLMVQDKAERQTKLRTFFNLTEPTSQRGPLFTKDQRKRIIDSFCDDAADVFEARGVQDPREKWTTAALAAPAPTEVEIPPSYIEAVCQAGIYSGALGLSKPTAAAAPPGFKRSKHVTEIAIHDLETMRQKLDHASVELDYMKNSVSWKVSAPLRNVMRIWKRLRNK